LQSLLDITATGLNTTILRRSAGLPYCFLAIFNSGNDIDIKTQSLLCLISTEPLRHEHQLLNSAVPRLLSIAGGEQQVDEIARVCPSQLISLSQNDRFMQ